MGGREGGRKDGERNRGGERERKKRKEGRKKKKKQASKQENLVGTIIGDHMGCCHEKAEDEPVEPLHQPQQLPFLKMKNGFPIIPKPFTYLLSSPICNQSANPIRPPPHMMLS